MENGHTDNQRKINNVLLVRIIDQANLDIIFNFFDFILYIFFLHFRYVYRRKYNVVLSFLYYRNNSCNIFNLMPQFQSEINFFIQHMKT